MDQFPPPQWIDAIKSQTHCEFHIRLEASDEIWRDHVNGYISANLWSLDAIADRLVTLQIGYFSTEDDQVRQLSQILSKAGRLRSLEINANHRDKDNLPWVSTCHIVTSLF